MSLKTLVLDSWAILEWMNGREPAKSAVAALFGDAEQSRTRLLISAINVGEIYYFLWKQHSEKLAAAWRKSSGSLPVTIKVPSSDDIWNAASLKARFPIAYADGFAAALARKYNCPLVTGDVEFRRVDELELEWIGRP